MNSIDGRPMVLWELPHRSLHIIVVPIVHGLPVAIAAKAIKGTRFIATDRKAVDFDITA